jgi:hypothetical protein
MALEGINCAFKKKVKHECQVGGLVQELCCEQLYMGSHCRLLVLGGVRDLTESCAIRLASS